MKSAMSNSAGNDAAVAMRRFVNSRIAEAAGRFDLDQEGEYEFVCECGDLSCAGRVKMKLARYRHSQPGSVLAH